MPDTPTAIEVSEQGLCHAMYMSYYLLMPFVCYFSLTAQNEEGPSAEASITSCHPAFKRTARCPFLHFTGLSRRAPGCEMADASFKLAEIQAEKHRKHSNDASKSPRERATALQSYGHAKNVLTNPLLRKPSIIVQEFRTEVGMIIRFRRSSMNRMNPIPAKSGYFVRKAVAREFPESSDRFC